MVASEIMEVEEVHVGGNGGGFRNHLAQPALIEVQDMELVKAGPSLECLCSPDAGALVSSRDLTAHGWVCWMLQEGGDS